jgi:sugar phosphate isomerase/epimerase
LALFKGRTNFGRGVIWDAWKAERMNATRRVQSRHRSFYMSSLSRRQWLTTAALAAWTYCRAACAEDSRARSPALGFSLYGMKSLPLREAVAQCAAIGYRAIELPVLPGWPGDTSTFATAAQKEFQGDLKRHGLRLSALMENLPILGNDAQHRRNLDRLKAAAHLAKTLAPDDSTLVETILGGKPAEWDNVKTQFVDRLGDWLRVMADAGVRLAIKAHIANALQTPQQLRWILDQLDNPWLTAAYDYSHFELQKLSIEESLKPLANRPIHFVHVKDAQGEAGKFQFLLPGEGKTNYGELFAALAKRQYQGDIVVEVSGQIFSKADYDGVAAAKKCFAALSPAMRQFASGGQP